MGNLPEIEHERGRVPPSRKRTAVIKIRERTAIVNDGTKPVDVRNSTGDRRESGSDATNGDIRRDTPEASASNGGQVDVARSDGTDVHPEPALEAPFCADVSVTLSVLARTSLTDSRRPLVVAMARRCRRSDNDVRSLDSATGAVCSCLVGFVAGFVVLVKHARNRA